ncbi:hypothetical protein R3P38DRAFT_2802339 [Favolaschia claudopus]|uniref:Uncharacterized protein n=1 Tax=Favolaschia claudopus TaxID=2862362 RepID=A0AAV9ZUA3_9AGAR
MHCSLPTPHPTPISSSFRNGGEKQQDCRRERRLRHTIEVQKRKDGARRFAQRAAGWGLGRARGMGRAMRAIDGYEGEHCRIEVDGRADGGGKREPVNLVHHTCILPALCPSSFVCRDRSREKDLHPPASLPTHLISSVSSTPPPPPIPAPSRARLRVAYPGKRGDVRAGIVHRYSIWMKEEESYEGGEIDEGGEEAVDEKGLNEAATTSRACASECDRYHSPSQIRIGNPRGRQTIPSSIKHTKSVDKPDVVSSPNPYARSRCTRRPPPKRTCTTHPSLPRRGERGERGEAARVRAGRQCIPHYGLVEACAGRVDCRDLSASNPSVKRGGTATPRLRIGGVKGGRREKRG